MDKKFRIELNFVFNKKSGETTIDIKNKSNEIEENKKRIGTEDYNMECAFSF